MDNYSLQPILINENKFMMFNERLDVGDEGVFTMSSGENKFAALNGQSIRHIFTISSAIDNSPICVVTSTLSITLSGGVPAQPTSNNEARCKVGFFVDYRDANEEASNVPIYGTSIAVE